MTTLAERLQTAGLRVFERGWLSSNNVLFPGDGTSESVLVDTGYASHAAQTVELVRGALSGRRLDRIVNTHLHSDHCGGNHALQKAFGCAIAVPAGESAKVDAWDESALSYAATGQHCPRFRRSAVITAGEWLQCGRYAWQALAAPGHDPESVVLYQPDLALLISADALWENGFGVVFPELEGEPGFDDVGATLDRLAQLRIRGVIPGHGRPFDDIDGALERARRRLEAFVRDPRKHAQHAAKVLVKFHLLEVQHRPLGALLAWMDGVPYLKRVHRRYVAAMSAQDWARQLVTELSAAGSIAITDGVVFNR